MNATYLKTAKHNTPVYGTDFVDHEGITLDENGVRTLNLDLIFAEYIMDGKDGGFTLKHDPKVVLAMNPTEYRGELIHSLFSFGGWYKGEFNREVFQGPMVDGPRAFMYEKDVVIHNGPYTKREGFEVQIGDHLIIRGEEYVITSRYHRGVDLINVVKCSS